MARKCMPGSGFADLDRANDVRMLHALAVARFAKKARDRGAVLAQLFAQHFHGDGAVVGMLRAEDGGRSAFADFALQRIAGDRLSDEVFSGHAANLTSHVQGGASRCAGCTLLDKSTRCFYIGPRKPGGLPSTAVQDRFTP